MSTAKPAPVEFRILGPLEVRIGGEPIEVGGTKLPLALQGASGGVVSLNFKLKYQLDLGVDKDQKTARRKLIEDLNKSAEPAKEDLAIRARETGAPYVGAPEALTYHAVHDEPLRRRLRDVWRWRDLPVARLRITGVFPMAYEICEAGSPFKR